MPIAFVAGAEWRGLGGVAAAWLALSPITIIPLVIVLRRTIHLPYREYVAALFPSLVGSVPMCLSVLAFRQWLLPAAWSPRLALAVQVAVGGAVYSAVLLGFFRERVLRYVRFLRDMRNRNNTPALTSLPVEAE